MKVDILYVEDDPSDVELFKSFIEIDKKFEIRYAKTMEDVESHLKKPVDIIITDYNLKGFNGVDVLNFVRQRTADLPIIFFTSTLGEEKAVELIKKGATDFVLKDNIEKLPLAVDRAYNEFNLIKSQKESEVALLRRNQLFNTLFNSLTDLVMLTDTSGIITQVNNSFCRYYDTAMNNVLGKQAFHFLPGQEIADAFEYVLQNRLPINFEYDHFDSLGQRTIFEIIKSPLIIDDELEGTVTVVRNITRRKLLEEKTLKDRLILQQAEAQTYTGSFEFDEDNDILMVSANLMKLLNLRADQNIISFKKLVNSIFSDDRSVFASRFDKAINDMIEFEMDLRYIPTSQDDFRYGRIVLKPVKRGDHKFVYGTLQDITEERESSHALLNIQEQEREKISKELHDNVGQKLSASSMFLDSNNVPLAKVKKLVDEAVSDIRSLSRILTTSNLEGNSFLDALEFLIENTPNSEIIDLDLELDDEWISPFISGQIYRILQEAINNSMKYSGATKISIRIFEEDRLMKLLFTDNGKGFDVDHVKLGNGVRNMRDRARNCNGIFEIKSNQHGTIVSVQLPIPRKHE
ncbi:response regulator [Marinoscillum sp. MHG1-6]|uniref:hybrid sensor histidine kinase/response regulator n=1 Tax=Marinoscillum sp. MHG1-6 TaxID=2959627 RepID=UPI002157EF6A|nr:response regulator [Marinoscillum sp. MHG1-6]